MYESRSHITLKIKNPSWWNRRTRTEKCLYTTVVLLILLIIILLGLVLYNSQSGQDCKFGSHTICLTPNCIKTANEVLQKIDLTVNPCEDFYQFACGNFIKETVLPEDKNTITSFSIVEEEVDDSLHSLLKKPITAADIRPFILVKTYFRACMNTTEINKNSFGRFKHIIKNMGGWPVIEGRKWNEDDFHWIATSYKFMKAGLGANMLFSFQVLTDVANTSRRALNLDQIGVPLEKTKRNGFNDTIFQSYYEYMKKMAVAFGAEEQAASEEMQDVAELIITLTKITVPAEERRNSTLEYNPMTIEELEKNYKYVPWLEYINTLLQPYKKMKRDDAVIVTIPSYFEKLESVLNNTPKRTLANYMYWCVVEPHITFLTDQLRDVELSYYKVVSGVGTRAPRWKECTERSLAFSVGVGALFVRNLVTKETKNTMTEMVGYIQKEFAKILKKVEWMDDTTRKHALNKLHAMHTHPLYPQELLDDSKVENYYKNLTFDASDYLGYTLNLSLFQNGVNYPKLDEKVDKKDWRDHSYVATVTAYYLSNENSIEILPGILRNVFFDSTRPQYLNYGAIGHVIGHEITHGFDDEGRQYDKDGNLKDWWQQNTKNVFDSKTQCIIDQYGNVTDPEANLNLNSINTQGENIADNAGIKLAYLAYKEWSKKHGSEQVLPGLPFTPEQMFWISVGNLWCEVQRREQLKVNILHDSHAPGRYRVNLSLRNSKYFAQDFHCDTGSKMNPQRKCQVW